MPVGNLGHDTENNSALALNFFLRLPSDESIHVSQEK